MSPATRIVIVGGGTAGWMTAASLVHRLGPLGIQITLVESSAIATVGVGEATVPAIRRYFASLGLDTFDVMRACGGTLKLGIEFADWREEGHSFFHSFGQYGVAAGPVAFHHLWQRLHESGEPHALDTYCLATQMAYAGRFAEPSAHPRADFEIYDWAIHFDAGRFALYLREYAEALGVSRIDARIASTDIDKETGNIQSVQLDSGDKVAGDLFIDCSGFRGLLIQGALHTGYRDWCHWLPCDRAVALPCTPANSAAIAPYTRAHARSAGWTWRIPLQHRVGNGYVYSAAHATDDQAEETLRQSLEGEALAEPNRVRFTAGHADRFWNRNCIAIGLSGGFLEPLESTSITLIQVAIERLIQLWPGNSADPRLAAEFNRHLAGVYERIRDFIILHYSANRRLGDPLWDHCRRMTLPDTLQHRIDLFRASGEFVRYDLDSFFDASWLCMFEGFDLLPERGNPWAERFPLDDLRTLAFNLRNDIAQRATDAPSHIEVLRQRCWEG